MKCHGRLSFTQQFLAVVFVLALPIAAFAGGCCAGHGGAVSCNAQGQQVCKDKTISPTCKCKAKAAPKAATKKTTTTAVPATKKTTTTTTTTVKPATKATTTAPVKQKAAPATTTGNGRGCCSRHGGVASCNTSTGFDRCKDGTDSPSCKCQ